MLRGKRTRQRIEVPVPRFADATPPISGTDDMQRALANLLDIEQRLSALAVSYVSAR